MNIDKRQRQHTEAFNGKRKKAVTTSKNMPAATAPDNFKPSKTGERFKTPPPCKLLKSLIKTFTTSSPAYSCVYIWSNTASSSLSA